MIILLLISVLLAIGAAATSGAVRHVYDRPQALYQQEVAMRFSHPAILVLLGFVILTAAALPADAYTWAKNSNSGKCLYWLGRQVGVHLNQDCNKELNFQQCEDAVLRGLLVWNDPGCSDFQFEYLGVTSDSQVGYDSNNPQANTNLIIWRESQWQYAQSAIAITTTIHEVATGKIVDADLELNAVHYTFSAGGTTPTQTDIQNTVAHEAGHMLGLDHSDVAAATMYAETAEGDIKKRDLDQDDIDGLCRIYPAGEKTIQCDGALDPDPPDPMERVGCAATTGSGHWGTMPILIFLLFCRRMSRPSSRPRCVC